MKIRFSLFVFLAAIVVIALVSTRMNFAQEDSPRTIEITARRFSFEPAEITIKKGQPVDIVIESADVEHGLHFSELNLEVKIPKGGTADLRFTPDKAGDFVGHCAVFCGTGHGSMALTLHVEE